MSVEKRFPAGVASTRGVEFSHGRIPSVAGGHDASQETCAVCHEFALEIYNRHWGDTGAEHQDVRCVNCGAKGCLSLNMPGSNDIVRRGRALRGDSR